MHPTVRVSPIARTNLRHSARSSCQLSAQSKAKIPQIAVPRANPKIIASTKSSVQLNNQSVYMLGKIPKCMSTVSQIFVELQKISVKVQLRLLSNWGNQDKLSISSISLFDPEKHKISALDCLLSSSNIIQGDFNKLLNEVLDKSNSPDLFTISWPPHGEYATITFFIPNESKFSGIRIWNASTNQDQGVRNVEVYLDDVFISKEEVPSGFGFNKYGLGQNYHINHASSSTALLRELFPDKCSEPPLEDMFGAYPLEDTKSLFFIPLATFNNDIRFGINGIEIYDQSNKLIPFSQISDIRIKNCVKVGDLDTLFRENKESNNAFDMFLADARDWRSPPEIQVVFQKSMRVTRICFLNFNGNNPSVRAGISALRIKNDKRSIWLGKLNMGSGLVPLKDWDRRFISFVDIPQFYSGCAKKLLHSH